jgi:hypothetical protein
VNVGELRRMIANYPEDMPVTIEAEQNWPASSMKASLRDTFRDGLFDATVLQIRHDNYGKSVGLPHLSEAEWHRQAKAVLDGLADARRDNKWATRRFTSIHGDLRIYRDHGGGNDTCYGTAYDPRVFASLVQRGWVSLRDEPYGFTYEITDEGMRVLASPGVTEGRDSRLAGSVSGRLAANSTGPEQSEGDAP